MDPRVAAILARGTPPPADSPAPAPQGLDWIVARKLQDHPKEQSEIQRICSLPIARPLTDDEIEGIQHQHVKPQAYADGFRLQKVQAEAIQAFVENGGLFGPVEVGGGKCGRASTEFFDRAAGLRRRLDDPVRNVSVDCVDEASLNLQQRNATLFPSGTKKCVEVVLDSGHSIGISTDHPVLTSSGWIHASRLVPGDLVAVPRKLSPGAGLDISDEEIKFVAYLLADGGLSQNAIRFVDEPGETGEEFKRCCESLGLTWSEVPEKSKAVRINVQGGLPITRKWGIQGKLSKHKRVPAAFYNMSLEQTRLFLGRFWACDGHIQKRGRMECILASEGLIKDLRHLLLYLGVFCTTHYKAATCAGKEFDAWRLCLSGEDALQFLRQVKIPGQEDRQSKARCILEGQKRNTNTDVVPITWGGHRELAKLARIPLTEAKKALHVTAGQFIGRHVLDRFCRIYGIQHRFANNDIRWVKTKSVTSLGFKPVYDLSVDEHHNYVADGIVIHNTLISLRCISLTFEQGFSRAALFVPSQVYSQLVDHDIDWTRKRLPLGCTFHLMGGKSPEKRRSMVGGRRGCWVFPYSLLSTEDTFELLVKIRPDLIVFDEAHHLKNRNSARTKRTLSYWRKYRPRVVALSGTMTAKSLKDYAHLLMMCLTDKSPLPMEAQIVEDWANVLDSEQAQEQYHTRTTSTGPLRPLINWSNKNFPKTPLAFDVMGFRRAFQNRLLTTPGVVSSPPDALGTSIVIENQKADQLKHEGGAKLLELQDKLEDSWTTPSGDELEHAMLVWKWKNEFSAGFYNSLVWPDPGVLAERLSISVDRASELLIRSREHHAALQLYHKQLRAWFSSRPHKPGLDTPMLVGKEMSLRGPEKVGKELYDAWIFAREHDFEGRIERDSIPVRVCDYKLQAGIAAAKADPAKEGILWYYHQEIGTWLFELAQKAGLDVVHCPAGKAANEFLTKPGAEGRCRGKWLVASLPAHGTGKNLQFLTNQIFVEMPRTEQQAQQSIGRTHRKGQQADQVTITTLVSNTVDEMALAALLNDAIYVFETMQSQRKLLVATWNPMPTIYGSSVLQRAGIQATILNARQQQLLGEKFNKVKVEG